LPRAAPRRDNAYQPRAMTLDMFEAIFAC
jgi:hypothetical protein